MHLHNNIPFFVPVVLHNRCAIIIRTPRAYILNLITDNLARILRSEIRRPRFVSIFFIPNQLSSRYSRDAGASIKNYKIPLARRHNKFNQLGRAITSAVDKSARVFKKKFKRNKSKSIRGLETR